MPSSYQDLNSKTEKFNSDREARYKKPKISAPPQQFDTRSVMTRALLFLYIQGSLGFDSERQSVNAAARGRRPGERNDTSQAADLRRRLAEVDHLDRVARVSRIDGMMKAAMAKSQSKNDAVVKPDNEVPASTSDTPAQEPHSIPATEEHNTITQTVLRPGEREDVAVPLERGVMRQLLHELQTGQSRDAAPIPTRQGNAWFGADALPVQKGKRRKNGYSPVYSYSLFGPSSTRSNVRAGDAINKLLNYRLYEEMGGELKNKVTEVVNGLKVGNKVSYAQLLMDMQRVIYTLIGEHGKNSKKMYDLMLAKEEIAVQMFNYGGVDLVNQNEDVLETPADDVNSEYIEQRFNPDKNITGHGNELNQREGYLFPPVATESGNDYEGVISAMAAAWQINAEDKSFSDILATAEARINKNRLSRQKHPSEANVRHWEEVEKLYYKDAYKIDVVVDQESLEKREYFLLYRILLHYSLLEKSYNPTSTEYAELQADKQYAQDIATINTHSYTYLLNLNYDKLKRVAVACEGVDKKLWPLHTSELARETVGDNVQDLYLVNALIFKLINANCFNKNTALLLRPVDALKEYAKINPIAILPEKQTTSDSSNEVKSYQDFKNSNEFTKQSHYNHQFAHYIREHSSDEAKNITSKMALNHPVDATPIAAYTYGLSIHHQAGWLSEPNTNNADVLPGRLGVVRFSDNSLYVTAFIEGELREKLFSASEVSANPVLSTMSHMRPLKDLSPAFKGKRRGFNWTTATVFKGVSLYNYLLDSLWGSFIESPVNDYNFPFAELVFNNQEHQIDVKNKNLAGIVAEVIQLALVDTTHVLKERLWIKSDGQKIAENVLPLYKTLYAEFTDEMHEMDWEEFLTELTLLALQFAPIGIKFVRLPGQVILQIRQVVNVYRAQGLRGAALAKASAPSVMNIAVKGALQAGKLLARGAWEAVDPHPIDFMQQFRKAPKNILNNRVGRNVGSPLIQSAINKARNMNNLEQGLIKKGAVCWDGAVRFQHKAGLISTDAMRYFNQAKVRAHNYVAFIGDKPQLIHSASELKTVPVGSRIGIIDADSSELKHAMVLLDGSKAGGINNGYIGKSPGWEEIKLTDVLRWEPDGSIRLNNMPDNVKFVLVAEGGAYVGSGIPTPVKRWAEAIQGPAVKRQPDSGANIGEPVDKSAQPREYNLNLDDLANCLGTGVRNKRSPGASGGSVDSGSCRVVSGQSGGKVIELESPTRELPNNRPKLQNEEFERLMHVREVGKDPVTHGKTTGFVRIVTDDLDLDHLTGPYSAKFVLLKGPEGPKLVIGAIHKDSNVKIFSHPALTRFGSQGLTTDLPVMSAGYIGRSSDGNTFVVNVSGHYQPKTSDLKPMTEYLSKIGVRNPVIVGGGSELLAKVHYLWLRDGKLYRKNIFQ